QTWNFGLDGSAGHPNNQNLDGTAMAYFDDDILGASVSNNHVALLTPVFDNSGLLNTYLEFDYNFRAFAAIQDSFIVEVFDGSRWQMVFSRATDDCGNYINSICNTIPHAKIDITAYQNANCQVRFRYYDGHNSQDWGWYVGFDNVEVYSPFPNDLRVKTIISPQSGCSLSNAEVVEVIIQNEGANVASNFPIAFALNGTEVATEIVTANLAYKDTLIYQFTATADLSSLGQYSITAYTKLPNDSNDKNDTTQVMIQNDPVYTLPYQNDFETSLAEWTVSGNNASWQKGVPNSMPIDTAASGTQAWVTNLNGPYNNNELSYLTSPCFDFSLLSTDPLVHFYLNYDTEVNYDFAWMEYSLDVGATWQKIMASPFAQNWYNQSASNSWSGNSNGWISIKNVLNGLAGESMVKLRLVFDSDPGTSSQGVGFDKLSIIKLNYTDLSIKESLSPLLDQNLDCVFGTNTAIISTIKNYGKADTFNLGFHYQINGGSVISSNHSIFMNTFEEASIVADSTFDFDPTQNYQFKSWISVASDVNLSNDTLSGSVQNTTSNSISAGLPIYEDFSNSIPGSGLSNNGFQLISQWTSYGTQGGWRISDGNLANHSSNTAPASGMIGPNANYAYLEVSVVGAGTAAYLESPCLVLPPDTNVKLSFGYHKFGVDMGDLKVEVSRNGGNWIGLDSIIGQTHSSKNDPWLRRIVPLKEYAGQVVKVRFVGIAAAGFAGDMAIDNILVNSDSFYFSVIKLETESACYLSNQEQVSVKVYNRGDSLILPNSVNMHYQLDNQAVVSELIPDTIHNDSSFLFHFSQTADLSQYSRAYNFLTFATFPKDSINRSNTLHSQIFNYTKTVNQLEGFEQADAVCYPNQVTSTNLPRGWTYDTSMNWGFSPWVVQEADSTCQFSPSHGATLNDSTGPASAYSGNHFIFYSSYSSAQYSLVSTCYDATNQSDLNLEFYYHKYGKYMADLYIKIEDQSGNITTIDSILGETHFSNTDPWLKKTVSLSQYTNQQFRVIFSNNRQYFGYSDMALDDIKIYNPLTVSIDEFEAAEKPLTLYPNPSKGQYFIQSEATLAGLNYQVYDLRGQLIQSGNFEGKRERLDLSTQPNGVYFLNIPELKLREKLVKY
ncbi:MAG: T9SS type A sorting domain-containing protein, partial [Vicingaceae bacterium]